MHQYYSALKSNTIFRGFEDTEIESILNCLCAYKKTFEKNSVICDAGIPVTEIGIIVEGLVYISKTDFLGNRTIMSDLDIGDSFFEFLSFVNVQKSPVQIIAATKTTVIFLPSSKVLNTCTNNCKIHLRILKNSILHLAERMTMLQMKIDILSRKTTREKLLLYFEYESKTANSKTFRIHFSRAELADFLSLNASAMSRELCKMRDEGIITFKKNRFVLKSETKSD